MTIVCDNPKKKSSVKELNKEQAKSDLYLSLGEGTRDLGLGTWDLQATDEQRRTDDPCLGRLETLVTVACTMYSTQHDLYISLHVYIVSSRLPRTYIMIDM